MPSRPALPPKEATPPARSVPSKFGDAMTTGEAYEQLTSRGYTKKIGTLRRALKEGLDSGQLPPDLSQLGLLADWEKRRTANPKDNSNRWLSFSGEQHA
jgi:hypothetical protein